MRADLSLGLPSLYGFLLVLARVSGVLIFVPIPGLRGGPDASRIILALALTCSLAAVWPTPDISGGFFFGTLGVRLIGELTFGLLVGVAVSFLLESIQMAAQLIGLQAGYMYASTIDPTTEADSGVLQVVTQLFAGFLFFAMGFDRVVIRILARSFDLAPVGESLARGPLIKTVVHLGSAIFDVGLRLALPVLALLLLVDITFAILGRINPQLQLLSLSFSAKMLAGLLFLASILSLFPVVLRDSADRAFQAVLRVIGG